MEKNKCVNVGGQAVIEGVMMKGPNYMATAVRKPTGEIVYRRKKLIKGKFDLSKVPFIRGVFMLVDSLVIGMKELTFSAAQAGESEEDEMSDFEIGMTMFISLAIGIGVFMLLPSFVGGILQKNYGHVTANIVEGIIRVSLFLLYIWGISFMKDIQRVFQYHGAEHKSIFTHENGEQLIVENAKKYTTLHPRCGTSFLFMVMIISIVVFAVSDFFLVADKKGLYANLIKFSSRVVWLPLIAAVAYEFQRFTSRHMENILIKILATPGLYLQKITTGEPDDQQLEVALVSLKAALGEENIENAREIKEESK